MGHGMTLSGFAFGGGVVSVRGRLRRLAQFGRLGCVAELHSQGG
jgi:hypothetical protein